MSLITDLRKLVWLYLILLIFEGALRKWIVPALDAPLLLVRDPLVIWIYYVSWSHRLKFNNAFFVPNLVLAFMTTLTTAMFGWGNMAITIYGLRTNYLQVPFIFLIPQILNRDDVIAMGRFFLYWSIPIAVLAGVQFRSPQDSLVNKGAFATHYATVRPSGPFSFIAGFVAYFTQASSFLFYGYLELKTYKMWLLIGATFAMFIAVGVSGSRTCLVSIGIVAVVMFLCVFMRGKGGFGIIIGSLLVAVLIPILSTLPIFQEGTQQLTQRFADAGAFEGNTAGFVDRYAGSMLGPLERMDQQPFWGRGTGVGTNAAMTMISTNMAALLPWPEDEWSRLIFESGPILGCCLILFRILLTLAIGVQAFGAFRRGNVLPLLIFAASGLLVLNGQWGVPTSAGFAIIGAGLTLAACVDPPEVEEEYEDHEHDHETGDESHHSPADTVG
jgi:hypothetical protein